MTTRPATAQAAPPASAAVARRAAARRRALQRRRPRLSRLLAWLLAAWLGHAGLALAQVAPGALPGGGQVMVGSGQLLLSPNLLVIQQNSNRLGLDWQSFNIGSGAAVEFRQPDAGSVALNRVVGHSGSQIYGQLKANGQVFLTNPNGILFAPGSKVDVGGLVASTLDLSQADFADGRYVFNAVGAPGRVVNRGTLNASAGGYVALFGPSVDNAGDVSVHAGSVVLASGRAATVSISGSGLISAVVTPGTVAGSVDNSGRITADGGVVTLSAKSAQDIAASLVNNSGIVRANTLVEKAGEIWITGDQVTQSGQVRAAAPDAGDGGRILLIGDMARGSVRVAGALDASAAAGRGGFIETSAARVQVADGTRVTAAAPQGRAGTWLIDPTDFTVGASGALTTSGIGADTLAATLDGTVGGPAGTSVTLATAAAGSEAGDIHVNADVSWSAATTLTLQAHGHINLNASLTASGDGAGMVFTPGAGGSLLVNTTDSVKPKVTLSGANATLNIAGQDYTLVRDLAGLQSINSGLGGRYALVADIDASSTAGSGFTPIGNETSASVTNTGAFTGIFEGLGHGISGLTIERPTSNATGLFASTFGATLRNFELIGGSVAGSQRVGAVAGYTRGATTLTNVRSSASVSALDDSSSGVWAGGLVGHVEGSTAGVSITRSVSTGAVGTSTATATAFAGGLVGEMDTGVLSDVSAGGTITSTATGANDSGHHAGGLIGLHNGGNITSAAATGNVTGGRESGGLVGRLQPSASATLSQVSASGDVSGTGNVGGLVGYASGTGAVTNASATGSVDTSTSETVSFHAGGAIGRYSMTLAPSAVSAAGNVTGGNTTGGVVGWIESNVALGAGSLVSVDPVSGSKLVTGARWVGGLIGYSDSSSAFSGLSANAVVTATGSAGSVGGLIGRSNGAISNSSSSGSVSGGGDTGGLVGRAQGTGGLTNVSSSSTVTSTGTGGSVGGLVGSYTNSGSLNTASASGAVQGGSGSGSLTGGLVGTFSGGGSLVDGSTATTSTVAGGGDVGGLVGQASGSGTAAITGSTARGTVTGASNVGRVGGLVGEFSMAGGWSNVTAEGAVSGGQSTGGLAGYYNSNAAITGGSYTPASITGGTWVGGVVGYVASAAAITGPAAVAPWVIGTQVTSTATGGGAGGLAGRTGGAVSFVTTTGDVSSASQAGGLVGEANGAGGFTGVSATGSVSSSGTTVDVGGLVGRYTNSGALQDASATGDVSGGRYTGGLVGEFSTSASMSSVRAEGLVSGTGDVGGLAGYASGSGGVSSAEALGDVVSSATATYSVGGAFGYFNLSGSSSGISAAGDVSGGAHTGGVIGYYATSVALTGASINQVDSVSRHVSGYGWVGGMLGYSNAAAITGLSSSATVTGLGTSASAGGLAGRTGGAVTSSSAGGNVVSGGMAGGLVAQADGAADFTDVSATGNVTGRSYVGGLIGFYQSNNTLLRAQASGDVVTDDAGGGLVGYHYGGPITDSSASGQVTGVSESTLYLGGLVGHFGSSCYYCGQNSTYVISNSHATGNVRADSPGGFVGGLVGLTYSGIINNSTASGHVTALDSVNTSSNEYVGGLVGYFGYYNEQGTISGSSASGNVSGGYYSGGLTGFFYGSGISDSSASGAVNGGAYSGGLIGYGYLYGPMADVSASGDVTLGQTSSSGDVGGLAGALYLYNSNQTGGSITNASASGRVSTAAQNGNVGGLVGLLSASSSSGIGPVNDSRASGDVSGGNLAGGLIGYFYNYYGLSALLNSSASGNVSSRGTAGGLVGYYYRNLSTGRADDITNSHATGSATANNYVGGLVGQFEGRYGIAGSYASGEVIGSAVNTTKYLGGLVGYYYARHGSDSNLAPIQTSYAAGRVRLADSPTLSSSTDVYAGGLVGQLTGNLAASAAVDSYATGAVTLNANAGDLHAGGLVGYAGSGQGVLRAYASGHVSTSGGNSMTTGGLLATRSATTSVVTDSYWDSDTTGQATSTGGGTALGSPAMRQAASFTNWAIASDGTGGSTWRIYEGYTAPLLTRLLTPLTLTLADASKVYDGTQSFGNASLAGASGPVSFPDRIFAAASSADVGSYSVGAAGVYSVQTGYDLTVTGSATLTVTPRPITLAGVVADKVYDGTRAATLLSTAQPDGMVAGEQLTVDIATASAVFDTKNVGQNKSVSITGLSLSDGPTGKAANYQLTSASASTASITPAALNAGGFTATHRAYDGSVTVAVAAAGGTATGAFAGDDVSVDLAGVSSGTMADKHVGTGKPVTVLGVALTGTDAGNYVLAGIDAVTVDITPRTLTVNGLTGSNRAYNQSLNVSVNTASGVLAGAVAGDTLELAQRTVTGQLADRHVGTAKPVAVGGSSLLLRGPDAANYRVDDAVATVNITPATVYFYADYYGTGRDKVYDGNDLAGVTPYAYINFVGNYLLSGSTTLGQDNLTLSYDAPRYGDKNVAYSGSTVTSKTITVANAVLGGTEAGNYVLDNTSTTTSGRITPKPLSVTGVTAENRPYDGTVVVNVDVTAAAVDTSGVLGSDVVNVSLPSSGTVQGTVADKTAGTAKPVAVPGFSLSGADAGNYSLTGSSGVTVDITRKELTAVYTVNDKVYDGNPNALVTVSSPDIVVGDSVRFYADQNYCTYCGYAYYVTDGSTPTNYNTSAGAGTGKTVVITTNGMYSTDAANYELLNPRATVTGNITPKGITPVFTGVDKVYDGNTTATVNVNTSASGILSGDAVSLNRTAVFGDANVGTAKAISVSDIAFTGTAAGNYTLATTTATTTADITPKPLSVQGVTATDRAYDGTTAVQLTLGTLGAGGIVGSDDVVVNAPTSGGATGSIANKNVGSNKAVTVSGFSLSGTAAGNYLLDGSQGVTVNITPRPLTVAYAGVDRVYNGGVSATVTPSPVDLVTGDVLSFTQNAIYTGLDARNVGTDKPISVTSIVMSGTDAGNYALQNTTASATADISAKPITVTYTGQSRVYNGLADVSASVLGASSGLVAGDLVTYSQTALFAGDGSAGVDKPVNISGITLGGAQAANYSLLNTAATTTATISPRLLGVTGVTATDRAYDGTTTVQLSTAGATVLPAGVLAGDQVDVVLPSGGITTGTVATKDAGNNKDVSITGLTLSGSSAANYSVGGASGLTVNIAPRALTAVYGAASRDYDGSALASVSASSADILSVDVGAIGISASGQFSDGKNVGADKTVTVSGGFLTGVERNNYTLLNPTGTATASITPRALTAQYTGGTRVYDGGIAAPVTASGSGLIAGDTVSFGQTAVFSGAGAKNVGNAKPIQVSDITLGGVDAQNYALTSTSAGTTGSITPKRISIDGLTGATATGRVYDGTRSVEVIVTTSGALSPSSADIVAGDDVSIALPAGGITTGTMADKHAGASKPLVVDGLTLGGTDAANYEVAATTGITVDITRRPLTAVYAGNDKVYDGTALATAGGSSADLLAGDSLVIAGTGAFTGTGAKNVGSDKPVAVLAGSLSGTDAGNYVLTNPTGSTTASITPRDITPSYSGLSRVYDGSTDAPVSAITSGFVAGDAVGLQQTAVFSDGKNVGSDKPVAITGIGLTGGDAFNYQLTSTSASASGSVTPKPLRIDGLTGVSATDRVYDGSTVVEVTVTSTGPIAPNPADVVGSDDVTVTAPATGTTTGTMIDKHVGTAKPVAVAGLALGGADAANYSITATSGVTVDISPKGVTAIYSAGTRVYDGSTAAAITGSSSDLIAGDTVGIGATGVFTGSGARNVGTDKPVDVTGGALSGVDAANYALLNPTGSTTGSITPKSVAATYLGGTRVYDGGTTAPVTGSATGFIAGDAVSLTQTAVFTGAGARNVGNHKPVEISAIGLTGGDAGNYALLTSAATTTASITPRPLRIEGFTGVVATDRVYDGTTAVAISIQGSGAIAPNAADVVPGDDVSVVAPPTGAGAGTMADKHVGSNKPVTVNGLTLAGSDAGNYSVAAASGVTVDITPRPLTALYTGLDKVYDGTALAGFAASSSDILAGDLVTLTGNGLFTGAGAKNVGTAKAIEITGVTLGSADAANYSLLNPTGSTTASITPRLLTPAYAGGTRVYDGTTTAPVTLASTDMIAGDDLSFTQTAVFSGAGARNVGVDKPVAVSGITVQGADAGNYALTTTAVSTTATVTPRPLNVSGLSGLQAVDRAYDGTRDVQITGSLVVGSASGDVIAGDDVTIGLPGGSISAGTMVDKSAGTGKAVAVSGLSLGGADAPNYEITGVAGLTVNIAPRPVLLLGVSAVNRVYDGSTVVAINSSGGSLSGVLAGDDLQLRASGVTGSMADKHVGSGKAVAVTGLSFTGADVANYAVDDGGGLRVDITPRTLVVTATAADKLYDGSPLAAVTLLDDRIAGDTLSLTSASATFAGKDAGAAQAVSVSGLALTGADAGNYALLASTLGTTASINRAPLAVSAHSLSKVYGESVNLTGTEFTTLGLVAGESLGLVTLASDGTASTAPVTGSPYAISVSDARGGSFNPANYALTYTSGLITVTPRPLTIAANSVVRTADEPNPASFGFSTSVGGLFGGDSIASVVLNAPAGSATAAGGSIFELVPSAAVFGTGQASNYALSYDNGLLVVLPRPPRVDDVDPNEGNPGQPGFAVQVDQAELERALAALQRNASVVAQTGADASPGLPPALRNVDATAAEISVLLAGDSRRITLPALLRLPLISFDPQLRRLVFGGPAGRTPPSSTAP